MRKFETIFILQILSGRCLKPRDSWKGMLEVTFYLCNIGIQDCKSTVQVLTLFKFNSSKIKQAIIEQHPYLSSIVEEANILRDVLVGSDWVEWGQNKIRLYGKELQLSIPSNIDFFKVLPEVNPMHN